MSQSEELSVSKSAAADGISDGLNYLNPNWLALTDAVIYRLQYNSIDGFNKATVGSGSINARGWLSAETGTQAESTARVRKENISVSRLEWGKDRIMTARVKFSNTTEKLGLVDGADYNFTSKHIGFGAENGDLVGISSNGSVNDKVVLESNPATPIDRTLQYRLTANEKVEFYVDGVKSGETTTVPSGESSQSNIISNLIAKNPNGSSQTARVGQVIGVQQP